MHCPACGQATTTDQMFCRSCGMSLEAVSKLVAAHSPSDEVSIQKADSEKAALARMVKWMLWGFLVLGLGVLLLVTQKTFALDRMVRFFASCLLLGGTGIAMYGLLTALRDGASTRSKPPKPNKLPPAETTKSLPEERVPVSLPSVTEATTELLERQDVRNTSE
jgi:hypothetical protein